VLLFDGVGHDDQEEVEVLSFSWLGQLSSVGILAADVLEVVVVDGFFEVLDSGLVAELNDVSVVDVNVESSLVGKLVESVVEVLTMGYVLLKAENCPLSEGNGLVNDGSQDLGVVKRSCSLGWCTTLSLVLVTVLLVNLWSF